MTNNENDNDMNRKKRTETKSINVNCIDITKMLHGEIQEQNSIKTVSLQDAST